MRKLILSCLMLITGLTQAQTFDFSCVSDSIGTNSKIFNIQVSTAGTPSSFIVSGTLTEIDAEYTFTQTLPESLSVIKKFNGDSNFSKLAGGLYLKALPFDLGDTEISFLVKADENIVWGGSSLAGYGHKLFISDFVAQATDVVVTYKIGHGQADVVKTITVGVDDVPEQGTTAKSYTFNLANSFVVSGTIQEEINTGNTGLIYKQSLNAGLALGVIEIEPSFVLSGVERKIEIQLEDHIVPKVINYGAILKVGDLSISAVGTLSSANHGEDVEVSTDSFFEGYIVNDENGYTNISNTNDDGFVATIKNLEADPSFITVTVSAPEFFDYASYATNTINLDEYISELIINKAEFVTILNGVEQEPVLDGNYKEFVIIDGSENYQGDINVTIDGTLYEDIEHPGNAWSKQIADTRFFVVIYGPTAPVGEEYKLNSWRIAHYPVGDEDTTHTVNWEKVVEVDPAPDGIAGIDFSIDGFSFDAIGGGNSTAITIGWSIAGESEVFYQTVTPTTGYYSYKGSIDLPKGITTQDIGDWTIWDNVYNFGLKMQESADGDENLEWKLVLGDDYFDSSLPTDAAITPSLTSGLNGEYFHGIPDAVLPVIGDGAITQYFNGIAVANVDFLGSSVVLPLATVSDPDNSYLTVEGSFEQTEELDGEGNIVTVDVVKDGEIVKVIQYVDSDVLKKHYAGNSDTLDFGELTSTDDGDFFFQFISVKDVQDLIFTIHN